MNRALLILTVLCISLLGFSSCRTVQYQDYETYYETQYRTETITESYPVTEDVITELGRGEYNLKANASWFNTAINFGPSLNNPTYYYGYVIPDRHSKMDVIISISHLQTGTVQVLAGPGGGSIPINPTVYNYFSRLAPSMVWADWLDALNAWIKNASMIDSASLQDTSRDFISFDASNIQEFAIFVNSWQSTAITNVQLVWVDQVVTQKTVMKERQVPVSVPYQVEKQRVIMKEKPIPYWELP